MTYEYFNKERLFGTDGIRGTPGVYPLTDGMIFKIGVSIARLTIYKKGKSAPSKIVIGRDTRLTGRRIEAILAEAINFYGIDVFLAGTITTPGLSYLVKDTGADMGIMISASHNKATDNGIKFFNSQGYKLSQHEESWLENIIFSSMINHPNGGSRSKHIGKMQDMKDAQSRYIKFLISTVRGLNLKRIYIALDCGCGAASGIGAKLFRKLGAHVIPINDEPSGENINVGGAVNPSFLRDLVLESKVDLGIAIDGDGDRAILIDDKGNILDGDYIMAIVGNHFIKRNKLSNNTIVATVMSNLGFKLSLEENGGKVIVTKVGDKYVLEELLKNKLNLGGEQSGHIVFLDYLPSPDGLLTALQVLKVMKDKGISLSELASCMRKFPQVLVNIKVKEKKSFSEMPSVCERLQYFNNQLKNEGRILLRYSGTENLARVMVEGIDDNAIKEIANSLADAIKEEIGAELKGDHV